MASSTSTPAVAGGAAPRRPGRDRRGHGGGPHGRDGPLRRLLDTLKSGSGVNFATLNRFPRIVEGEDPEGDLTGAPMMKDLVLYVDHLRDRVVDAIGDVAGGDRGHDGNDETKGGS